MNDIVQDNFYNTFKKGEKVSGSFHVVKGGPSTIDLSIIDPTGRPVPNAIKKEKISFVAPHEGDYKFRFSGKGAKGKIVSLLINEKLASKAIKKDQISATELEKRYAALANNMDNLIETQQVIAASSRTHEESTKIFNRRATMVALLVVSSVISVAISHILYFRKKFMDRENRV